MASVDLDYGAPILQPMWGAAEVVLTREALGYPAERAELGGKWRNSRINGRRETHEALIEISQREDFNECLKFS